VFLDHVDWATGEPGASAGIVINTLGVRSHLGRFAVGLGQYNFGQLLLFVLARLADVLDHSVRRGRDRLCAGEAGYRQSDLFTGTLHVRAGDFGHQIPLRARDQPVSSPNRST
jgi:hypothetical protein